MTSSALTQTEKRRANRLLGQVKSVQEFLSDAVEGIKDTGFPEALIAALPWAADLAEAVGHALQEALPPIKFVVKLFEKLTKDTDPEKLGFLALTLAYEQAVARAIVAAGPPPAGTPVNREFRHALDILEPLDQIDIGTFSLDQPLDHEFVRRADDLLITALGTVGYEEAAIRDIAGQVHEQFGRCLHALLADGETREKFAPFADYLRLGSNERRAYRALRRHAEVQRRVYEEAPVFGREPFALKHVYVETDCGKLTWGEIAGEPASGRRAGPEGGERVDPFSERHGGRQSLVATVMDLIGDPALAEAIVIQGVAGAGKSSFTLRLCAELLRVGLCPIRVRLKDLRLDRHVSEALPEAVRFWDPALGITLTKSFDSPSELFMGGQIFRDATDFGRARICRYVLILDGWDEISTSATEGFKIRVEKLLDQVRSEYLGKSLPVRVILTGRPSDAVTGADATQGSALLRKKTPILTLRPMRPEQLEGFVAAVARALETLPVAVDHPGGWALPENPRQRFHEVFEQYRREYDALMEAVQQPRPGMASPGPAALSSQMEVLGLPLLAHLALRLMAQYPDDPARLIENPTALYRHLVDLTCGKSGKTDYDQRNESETEGQARVTGLKLREWLQRVATAMSVTGQESISRRELALRLEVEEEDLDQHAETSGQDHLLTRLMISFFFKGGHAHLGCEFLHKSFREYLFAEGIVAALKDYGQARLDAGGSRRPLEERSPYWWDFEPADPRHGLSRDLSKALAPLWLTGEVIAHLGGLIAWEFDRLGTNPRGAEIGVISPPLELDGWREVRDGLADLWDWWAEGVPLRPQPKLEKRRGVSYDRAYAEELVEWAGPQDLGRLSVLPAPMRTVTLDAHLGDALIRLCADVHYRVAKAEGFQFGGEVGESECKRPRRYQTAFAWQGKTIVRFAPSGNHPEYFRNYAARINGAGWRKPSGFPAGACLRGMDLRGIAGSLLNFFEATLAGAYLAVTFRRNGATDFRRNGATQKYRIRGSNGPQEWAVFPPFAMGPTPRSGSNFGLR